MKYKVSAVIPNYNYQRFLPEAIKSVLAQTHTCHEIIVVDDGSKDDSIEILRGYGDKIKVIQQKNQGVSAARNNGVAASDCDYIAFLDADDVWMPEKIEKQIALFRKDDELGIVHVGVQDFDSNERDLTVHTNGMTGKISPAEFLIPTEKFILGGGSGIMMPRRVFDEANGFDTNLSTSADWDLFYRTTRRHKVGFVPDILVRYRIHDSNMHSNITRMEREMMRCYEKAFAENDTAVQMLKRKAYGHLHRILAGSYFQHKNYKQFLRHTVKNLLLEPSNINYYLKFPIRRFKRIKTQNTSSF